MGRGFGRSVGVGLCLCIYLFSLYFILSLSPSYFFSLSLTIQHIPSPSFPFLGGLPKVTSLEYHWIVMLDQPCFSFPWKFNSLLFLTIDLMSLSHPKVMTLSLSIKMIFPLPYWFFKLRIPPACFFLTLQPSMQFLRFFIPPLYEFESSFDAAEMTSFLQNLKAPGVVPVTVNGLVRNYTLY